MTETELLNMLFEALGDERSKVLTREPRRPVGPAYVLLPLLGLSVFRLADGEPRTLTDLSRFDAANPFVAEPPAGSFPGPASRGAFAAMKQTFGTTRPSAAEQAQDEAVFVSIHEDLNHLLNVPVLDLSFRLTGAANSEEVGHFRRRAIELGLGSIFPASDTDDVLDTIRAELPFARGRVSYFALVELLVLPEVISCEASPEIQLFESESEDLL